MAKEGLQHSMGGSCCAVAVVLQTNSDSQQLPTAVAWLHSSVNLRMKLVLNPDPYTLRVPETGST